MAANYLIALHIIFMVTWFAGLFYIARLFIYATEANLKPEPERSILLNQFNLMKKRLLFAITWPGGLLTLIFGFWLLFGYRSSRLQDLWFILKLIFVGLLCLYHLQCHLIYQQQKQGIFKFSSLKLRLFNEIPTIVLFAVVFLVVIKENTSWVYTLFGIFVLVALILLGIFIYNRQRVKKEIKDTITDEEGPANPPPIP